MSGLASKYAQPHVTLFLSLVQVLNGTNHIISIFFSTCMRLKPNFPQSTGTRVQYIPTFYKYLRT